MHAGTRNQGNEASGNQYSAVLLIYTLSTQVCKKVLFMCDAKMRDVPGRRSRVKVHLSM